MDEVDIIQKPIPGKRYQMSACPQQQQMLFFVPCAQKFATVRGFAAPKLQYPDPIDLHTGKALPLSAARKAEIDAKPLQLPSPRNLW